MTTYSIPLFVSAIALVVVSVALLMNGCLDICRDDRIEALEERVQVLEEMQKEKQK